MPKRCIRNFVRLFVGAALGAAFVACAAVPVPDDLPAVAFGQASLYRFQVALLEISVRGAKFGEKADQSVQVAEGKLEGLEQKIRDLDDKLTIAAIAIDQLKERQVTTRDWR